MKTEVKICDIEIGDRFRKDLGDIGSLSDSIKCLGLLHPVVVTKDLTLVAGRRRLEACKKLGWTHIPVTIVDGGDHRAQERDENKERLDLDPVEALEVYEHFLPKEQEKAKDRQRLRSGIAPGIRSTKFVEVSAEASEDAAKATGYSDETLKKVKSILVAAEKEPEKLAPVVEKMRRTRKVDPAYKLACAKERLIPMANFIATMKETWLCLDKKARREFIKWTKTKEAKEYK